MRGRLAALAGAAATAAGLLAAPAAHAAAMAVDTGAPPALIGNDVSYPQCGTAGPASAAVAVVGVNDGLATGQNPCLGEQLSWAALAAAAAGTAVDGVQLYANTANPGHAASWWPVADVARDGTPVADPVGTCTGGEDPACAYVYGYSLALDDLRRVPDAASHRWWLDVETINSWSADRTANLASVTGMADALTAAGARPGLYSTRRQWTSIVGDVPATSTLAGLPSWMAGAVTLQGASDHCDQTGLTPGSAVAMAQYVAGGIDSDVLCGSLTTARPTIGGTQRQGGLLTAHPGAWGPAGVRLSFEWRRNGAPIAGATSRTYRVGAADAGADLTVTVRGDASGFRPASRTSAAAGSASAAAVPGPAVSPTAVGALPGIPDPSGAPPLLRAH